MISLNEAYRDAVKRQMPDVPTDLIDSLPCDFNDVPDGQPYIAQTGGWCMALECSTRAMAQDGLFYVGDYPDPESGEGTDLYEGSNFFTAWRLLTEGV